MRKTIVLFIHALIIWALCGLTIAIGRSVTGMELTLIIHAVGAPVFAAGVSWFYFKKYHYTTPLQTASLFLIFVMTLDAGLVAPVFEKSYEMFRSLLGTWIPFGLIFVATYVTGVGVIKSPSKITGVSSDNKGKTNLE